MSFMSFSHKMNVGGAYAIGVTALVTAFTLPAEISVLALLLAYPASITAAGQFLGLGDDWYGSALKLLYKLLALTIVVFAIIYWRYGLLANGQEVEISPIEALYFSITTWTTLGYGDFAPVARIRHITSVEAILGYVGLGLWVAFINIYVSIRAKVVREIHDKMGKP